jgi:hypothetical protein
MSLKKVAVDFTNWVGKEIRLIGGLALEDKLGRKSPYFPLACLVSLI